MRINADFSQRAVVLPSQQTWAASPQPGIERVMLDRVGEEKARATSLVRYAPESRFPGHAHPDGEEILVLEGTFSEGDAHYPAGWYMRNPPGSSHQPFSREGAVIFVKLRQMRPDETDSVRIDTRDASRWVAREGGETCPLFTGHAEQVSLERLDAGARLLDGPVGGMEILVLEGGLREGAQRYMPGSWIRVPPGDAAGFAADDAGATVYLKTGHLAGQPGVDACSWP